MTVYMVSIARVTAAKNDLGLTVNSREPLGNTLFEDKADANFYAAQCEAMGLEAFVFPRVVVRKEAELAVAS